MKIDFFNCLFIIAVIAIFIFPPGNEYEQYYITDINKTSHYAETDEFYYVGADDHKLWLENNPEANKTTISELLKFLKEDKTDEMLYNDFFFVCADYSELIHNNAEKQGIRTGIVMIEFECGGDGHAINVFDTIERGLVFYDSTNDDVGSCNLEYFTELEIGRQLIPIKGELLHENEYYENEYICDYYDIKIEGIVSDYIIIW